MPTATNGMGQQYGDATTASGQIVEVTTWDFHPANKLGGVVTSATSGFEGRLYGAVSGKGKVTILVPKTGAVAPFIFGADTVLNLYADQDKAHGFTGIHAALESTPVAIDLSSDKGVGITFNFECNGPYTAIGAFAVLPGFASSAPNSDSAARPWTSDFRSPLSGFQTVLSPYGLASMRRTLSYAHGWQAEMVYCLAAADVPAHIAAHYLDKYPGDNTLSVVQIADEPWMDGDVVQSSGMSATRKLTYSFVLDYLDVSWPNSITRPGYKAGTTLRLEAKLSMQYLTLPARSLLVSGTYTPATNPDGSPYTGPPITPPPPSSNNRFLIPLVDYLVEWDRVQDLAALDFSGVIGYVNQSAFMDCEPETLLCEGVALAPSFVLNPASPHAWKATVTLKKRRIKVGENVYGWNDEYLSSPPGWAKVLLSDGTPRYPAADFSTLFCP